LKELYSGGTHPTLPGVFGRQSRTKSKGDIEMRVSGRLLVPALAMVASHAAHAHNIDLSTVPDRESVQLTIYNSEDITLVRETRVVTFKKGANPLQFSWANTLIDPSSVELKFLTSADKLEVVDTTFPHLTPRYTIRAPGAALFRRRSHQRGGRFDQNRHRDIHPQRGEYVHRCDDDQRGNADNRRQSTDRRHLSRYCGARRDIQPQQLQ
jgi:hypothetical protein